MGRVFVLKNVRIYYKKLRSMKFISHLDMTRFMARLITKSGIPIWYTEGFNQHVYMNFAVPLSLGFEGLYEIMDIRLIDENYSLEDCLQALKGVCPPDIEFVSISEDGAHMKTIGYAQYDLSFETFENDVANNRYKPKTDLLLIVLHYRTPRCSNRIFTPSRISTAPPTNWAFFS